jgi:hypothetical protein
MHVIIAPCPKKPSSSKPTVQYELGQFDINDIQDACLELQQILANTTCIYQPTEPQFIIRANNPLVQDSCFIPHKQRRPRSHSVDYKTQPIISL